MGIFGFSVTLTQASCYFCMLGSVTPIVLNWYLRISVYSILFF